MKKLTKASILFLCIHLFFLTSCRRDDTSDGSLPGTDLKITLGQLELGISIEGAVKVDGPIPLPSGNINFSVGKKNQTAFFNTGVNLGFSSNSTSLAGAYVKVKDANGNPSDFYFDLPLPFNNLDEAKANGFLLPNGALNEKLLKEYFIRLNFNDDIPTGSFSVDISIYDDEENISPPTNIIVNVENFEIPNNFFGTWQLSRTVPETLNEPKEKTITCKDSTTIKALSYDKNMPFEFLFEITFDEKMSITTNYSNMAHVLQIDESETNCTPVYAPESSYSKSFGKCYYDESNKSLSIITYKNESKKPDGEIDVTNYEKGILVTVKSEITSDEFMFTEDDVTYYFKKK